MRRQLLHIDDLWAGLLYQLALLAVAAFFALMGALVGVAGLATSAEIPLHAGGLVLIGGLLAFAAVRQGLPRRVEAVTEVEVPEVEEATSVFGPTPSRVPRVLGNTLDWTLDPAEPRVRSDRSGSVDIRALDGDDLVLSDDLARALENYLADDEAMPPIYLPEAGPRL